jgi:REP element-mobilizing transposase RayT
MKPNEFISYEHAPTHLFVPGATYMLTAGTRDRRRLLASENKKDGAARALLRVASERGWAVVAWVILDNHYHAMLGAPEQAEAVTAIDHFCRLVHRRIAR